jgi:hypothetical protein
MTTLEKCITEILRRGLDDWIQAAEVASVVKAYSGQSSSAGVERVALEAIGELLRRNLMKAGEVTPNGFAEWGMTADAAVDRIVRDWNNLGRSPDLGEVCWLCNTRDGDIRARQNLE